MPFLPRLEKSIELAMPEKDYYSVLGVPETASEDDVRKAFRALAKKWHPDANKGDKDAERRFKEVSEANEVLSDSDKRAQYDQLRKASQMGYGAPGGFDFRGFGQGGQGGPGGGPGGMSFEDLGGFGDLFSNLFGHEARHSRSTSGHYAAQKGEDRVFSIEIPFDVAVHGGKRSITVPSTVDCPRCSGTGAEPGTAPTTCPTCKGTGSVSSRQGGFGLSRPCPQCLGRGVLNANACRACMGRGTVDQTKTLSVNIPRGIADGAKIRLGGQGEPGIAGGPPGDMYLLVRVTPHPDFERRGYDIFSVATVGIIDAALGTKVKVRTLEGEATLTIPPGTQPGAKLRLRGQGVKSADGVTGDQYVVVKVEVPRNLTPQQRKLLEEFAKSR